MHVAVAEGAAKLATAEERCTELLSRVKELELKRAHTLEEITLLGESKDDAMVAAQMATEKCAQLTAETEAATAAAAAAKSQVREVTGLSLPSSSLKSFYPPIPMRL